MKPILFLSRFALFYRHFSCFGSWNPDFTICLFDIQSDPLYTPTTLRFQGTASNYMIYWRSGSLLTWKHHRAQIKIIYWKPDMYFRGIVFYSVGQRMLFKELSRTCHCWTFVQESRLDLRNVLLITSRVINLMPCKTHILCQIGLNEILFWRLSAACYCVASHFMIEIPRNPSVGRIMWWSPWHTSVCLILVTSSEATVGLWLPWWSEKKWIWACNPFINTRRQNPCLAGVTEELAGFKVVVQVLGLLPCCRRGVSCKWVNGFTWFSPCWSSPSLGRRVHVQSQSQSPKAAHNKASRSDFWICDLNPIQGKCGKCWR